MVLVETKRKVEEPSMNGRGTAYELTDEKLIKLRK
jgi:hypothetical protein